MSKTLSKQSSVSRLRTSPAVTIASVVDTDLSTRYLGACEAGDIDACHMAVLKIHAAYPQSIPDTSDKSSGSRRRGKEYQPIYDLIGHGLTIAATRGHVNMVEFLLSGHYAEALRDGICHDPTLFPPFPALSRFEFVHCVSSIRFVCYAALACIDQLSMSGLSVLVGTRSLWDFEASLCLSLAMRRALDAATATSALMSPAAFHPIIVLLARHYDFLIDNIRVFHESFRPEKDDTVEVTRKFDRVQALQASVMYEIVISGSE